MRSLPDLRAALQRWLFRVGGPEPAPIVLGQRRIFVLPTRFGLALALTLLVMLLASINYTLSLGFALTFLIGSVGWISIHHAFRNLVGLKVEPARAEAVFCGTPARFTLLLGNPALRERHGLRLGPAGERNALRDLVPFDLPPCASTPASVSLDTTRRGWLRLPRLRLETRHPLGLIRAWSLFQPDARCIVYPAPETDGPALPLGRDTASGGDSSGRGQEDFAGLRHHQPADPPRHIAWKAVARGGPWRTKEFDGAGTRDVHLDWQRLPPGMGVEARLARLARWILEADRAGVDYALSLPGAVLPPGRGPAHRHACLTHLALFGSADA